MHLRPVGIRDEPRELLPCVSLEGCEPGTFGARRLDQFVEELVGKGLVRERPAIGVTLRDRPEEQSLVVRGTALRSKTDAGEQVRIAGIREQGHLVLVAVLPDCQAEVMEEGATAELELPVVRIDHRERSRPVGVEQDRVGVGPDAPRLGVVARGREDRVAEQKDEASSVPVNGNSFRSTSTSSTARAGSRPAS